MEGRSWVRSIVTLTLSAAALGAGVVVLKSAHDVRTSASMLPQELEAAMRDGIPVTPAELAAEKLSTPSRNAAPTYDDAIKLLKRVSSNDMDLGLKEAAKVFEGKASKSEKAAVHDRLLRFGPALEKALLGSVRTDCAFSPNWNQGSGFPQLKPLATIARLLAARAAVDHDLADLFAAVRVVNHIGQAPVLEAEQQQAVAVEAVCMAAWELAKDQPENAHTCRTIVEDLPGIRLDHRIGGELQRALAAIKTLDASGDSPLRDTIALPGSQQMSEAYETEVVRSLRRIHQLTVSAKRWPEIEEGLGEIEAHAKDDQSLAGRVLTVVIGPWAQTAHAARRAQERRASTVQALTVLGQKQPDYSKAANPSVA